MAQTIKDLLASSAFWGALTAFVLAVVSVVKPELPPTLVTAALTLLSTIFGAVAVNKTVALKNERRTNAAVDNLSAVEVNKAVALKNERSQ